MRNYIPVRYYNYDPVIEKIDAGRGEAVFYSRVMRKWYRVVFVLERNRLHDELEEISDDDR